MKQILDELVLLQNLEAETPHSARVGAKPDDLRKTIPAQILQHYDRLRARGKKGVAYVRRGFCGQCHMQIASGLLAALRRQDDLHRCENCGCYLCLVEETSEVMEMPPRAIKPGRRGRPRKTPAHVA